LKFADENENLYGLYLYTLNGYIKVYFGYRLPDGTLAVNAQPIEITID